MIQLYQLDNSYHFPSAESSLAEPNGLLAFGGDLSSGRLLSAYRHGIFPWFNSGEPLLWWSPDPRAILPLQSFHCSRSLKKLIRQKRYQLSVNMAFDEVIEACADVPRYSQVEDADVVGSWITDEMEVAYKTLHAQGHAQSIEVWDDKTLVGGLYGVSVGGVFCGESMFHTVSNASKLAFWALVQHMLNHDMDFIDCQLENPHLMSLGCQTIPRKVFLKKLYASRDKQRDPEIWQSKIINY